MRDYTSLDFAQLDRERDNAALAETIIIERAELPADIKQMELLAHSQFATAGQLVRTGCGQDVYDGCESIEYLLRKGFVDKMPNIKILYGCHKGMRTTAYFLTAKGNNRLKWHFPTTAKYAKVGFPRTIQHLRVHHHLLIAEAFLDYAKSGNILICRNEDVLRAEIEARNKKKRDAKSGKREKTGSIPDLEIISYSEARDELVFSQLEACVKLSPKQISRKSRSYWYYVYDERAAERVHTTNGGDTTIADEIIAPLEAEAFFKSNKVPKGNAEKKERLAGKISETLEKIGGGATKQFLLERIDLKETTFRVEMEKIVATKFVCKSDTSLIPGVSRGRDVAFYFLPERETDFNFKNRQTIRSYALQKLLKADFASFKIDFYSRLILTQRETGNKYVLLTEYDMFPDENPLPTEMKAFAKNTSWSKNRYEIYPVIYASANIIKIQKVKDSRPDTGILDLSVKREAQSYRYKIELTTKTITRDNRHRTD